MPNTVALPAQDTSQSDLVLRCYSPQMVARAYARASSGIDDSRDTLGWRLGFVDVAQRFLLAVLASQHAGLELAPVPAFEKLVDKLDTPSLGDVSKALEGLARALSGLPLDPYIRALVQLLAGPLSEERAPERTSFATQIQELIDLRNHLFHRDGSPIPDEATAARHLTEIEPSLREVCKSLRVLRGQPLLYVDSREERQDGTVAIHLLRFAGQNPEPRLLEFDDGSVRLPSRLPFLLLSSGDALLLSPFVVVERNVDSRALEARLMYGWNGEAKQFTYSPVDGGPRRALQDEPKALFTKRADLLALKPPAMLWKGAMSAAQAEHVRGRVNEEGFPLIEGFKIEGKLGTGASSTVYVARENLRDRPPGARVAIKVLHRAVTDDPVQRARLKCEYHILSNLEHPAIVKVLRFIETPGPSLVLEYINGEDLQSQVERRPATVKRAVQIAEQVLSALGAAHARGVFHRDVKPSNVLIDRAGHVRLIDFGIAAAEDLPRLTRTLDAVGTLDFAAPEQIRKSEDVGPPADIYAVGRLLEFLVTGKLHSLEHLPESLPAGLQAVIRKATQRDVPWRFGTAEEMLDALEERKSGGWGGAPVQVGDRLNDSYELHELAGVIDEVFAFRGAEIASERLVSIALASRHGNSQDRLRTAIQSCTQEVRVALGNPRLQYTADRILFAVFDGENPRRALGRLLGCEPAGIAVVPRDDAPGPVEAGMRLADADDTQRLGPPYMNDVVTTPPCVAENTVKYGAMSHLPAMRAQVYEPGWVHALRIHFQVLADGVELDATRPPHDYILSDHILSIAGLLETALLVLKVQRTAIAKGGVRQSAFDRLGSVGGLLLEAEREGEFEELPPNHLQMLRRVAAARNMAVHSPLDAEGFLTEDARAFMGAISAVVALVAQQARRLPNTQGVHPVIALMDPETMNWAILRGRGTGARYIPIGHSAATYKLTADAISWLAAGDVATGTDAVREERRERIRAMKENVRNQLATMDFCGEVIVDARAMHGVRSRAVDFLVLSRTKKPLLVVVCALDLESPFFQLQIIDRVWLGALALKAPFAAVADGTRWRWYRSTPSDGLQELVDVGEVSAHSAQGETDDNGNAAV